MQKIHSASKRYHACRCFGTSAHNVYYRRCPTQSFLLLLPLHVYLPGGHSSSAEFPLHFYNTIKPSTPASSCYPQSTNNPPHVCKTIVSPIFSRFSTLRTSTKSRLGSTLILPSPNHDYDFPIHNIPLRCGCAWPGSILHSSFCGRELRSSPKFIHRARPVQARFHHQCSRGEAISPTQIPKRRSPLLRMQWNASQVD